MEDFMFFDKISNRSMSYISYFLICILLVWFLPSPIPVAQATGKILYVNQQSLGNNSGSSWQNAFTNLQDALFAAQTHDQIWVAQGIYKPANSNDRASSFVLKNNVGLYGGFAGNEVSLQQRNWQQNLTILSGDIDNNDIHDHGVITDTAKIVENNSYSVVTANNVDESSVLDGFVITGGSATENSGKDIPYLWGGGIFNVNSQPSLRNLKVIGNLAQYGGGIANHNSNPVLLHVEFVANTAIGGEGGALYLNESNVSLEDVSFQSNSSSGDGGAIYGIKSTLAIRQAQFTNNIAQGNGGGIFMTEGHLTLSDSVFTANQGSIGGAVQNWISDSSQTRVQYINNIAESGGGLFNHEGTHTLVDLRFVGNQATVDLGGGLVNGAANTTLTNALFIGNRAEKWAGGFYNTHADPILTNVLFSGNYAQDYGGALYSRFGSPQLVNLTVTGNYSDHGAGMYNGNQSNPVIVNSIFWANHYVSFYNEDNSTPNISYSLIEGCNAGTWWDYCGSNAGNNLEDIDPLFFQPIDPNDAPNLLGDFHVLGNSPVIDRGNPHVNNSTSDVSNAQRVYGGIIDLGAYEYQQYDLTVHIVGNGDVAISPATSPYSYTSSVDLLAVPDEGWAFSGWSGGLSGSSLSASIIMSTTQVITATFRNLMPTAYAGSDQIVNHGALVSLDGSGSTDTDAEQSLSYFWQQTAGPSVSLSDPYTISPSFTAPLTDTVLRFSLVVSNTLGLTSEPDMVQIIVQSSEDSIQIYLPLVQQQSVQERRR